MFFLNVSGLGVVYLPLLRLFWLRTPRGVTWGWRRRPLLLQRADQVLKTWGLAGRGGGERLRVGACAWCFFWVLWCHVFFVSWCLFDGIFLVVPFPVVFLVSGVDFFFLFVPSCWGSIWISFGFWQSVQGLARCLWFTQSILFGFRALGDWFGRSSYWGWKWCRVWNWIQSWFVGFGIGFVGFPYGIGFDVVML